MKLKLLIYHQHPRPPVGDRLRGWGRGIRGAKFETCWSLVKILHCATNWNRYRYRPVTRIFTGGVRLSASGAKSRAPKARARRGVWGYPPQEIFKKMGYLRPHFVRFEDSLLRNKADKGEGSKDNNSCTFLNSKRGFRNRAL